MGGAYQRLPCLMLAPILKVNMVPRMIRAIRHTLQTAMEIQL